MKMEHMGSESRRVGLKYEYKVSANEYVDSKYEHVGSAYEVEHVGSE